MAVRTHTAIIELEDNAGTQFDPQVVPMLVGQVRRRYSIQA